MGIQKYLFRNPQLIEYRWRLGSIADRYFLSATPSQQTKKLRKFLRACPNWVQGHERLGLLCLEQAESVQKSEMPRLLSTVELSAEAIKTLSKSIAEQALDRSDILMCGFFYYKKSYAQALELAEKVLAQRQELLPLLERQRMFEWAGAAALAIGLRDKAKFYFEAIPREYQSQQTKTALRYLESDDSQAS